MVLSVVIGAITCAALTAAVYFFPQKKIGRSSVSYYALVPLVGAIAAIVAGAVSAGRVAEYFTSAAKDNPVKIIVLFISMSLISVYLDETGFFEYAAHLAVKRTGGSQTKIFLSLYAVASVLTVVTSNDIVILTFTPFICRFCKRCNVNAAPYVFSQFVAANTWSMLFVIGNPTNVFLAQSTGIDFIGYLKVMWFPTLFSGLASLAILLVIFSKALKAEIRPDQDEYKLKERPFTAVGLAYLIVCTLSVAVLPYFGLEMYYIAAACCVALFVTVIIMRAVKKQRPEIVVKTLARAPFEMIPLVLGMAIIALSLKENGVTAKLTELIGERSVIIKYGVLSTAFSNVLNNIPMSIMFADITRGLSGASMQKAVYSTVIGSNLGAYLTPLGALAGLMFTSVLKRHGVKFGFSDFIKYGVTVVPATLAAGLFGLYLSL